VADDLADAYVDRLAGRVPRWPVVPAFGEYVHWERANLGRWTAQDLPFWRRHLHDLDPLLPRDPSRAAEARRVEHVVVLDPARLHAFTALSRRQRLSALLHATAEAFDVGARPARMCLGTLVSGRREPRWRPVVGSFVNMMAVPVVRRPGLDHAARRDALTRTVLDCLRHSRTPFDEVVRAVPPPYWGGVGVEVLVSLNDWSDSAGGRRRDAGLDRRPIVLSAPRTAWGLMLEATRERDQAWVLRGRWRADGDNCRRIVDEVARAMLDR
jgi:mycobactin peptide synthetase MbtE